VDLYTNVTRHGNKLLYRGYDAQNKRISRQIAYKPYLFINSKNGSSEYHTQDGKHVDRVDFDTIGEMREFQKTYKDVSGFRIYGMDNPILTFLNDEHPKTIDYRKDRLCIANIDIEVASDGHFATIENPDQPVTTITLKRKMNGVETKYAFGYFPWPEAPKDVIYVECGNEATLLRKFLDIWVQSDFDIITGWYTDLFDIPYLVRRMNLVHGEELTKKLSPWGIIEEGQQEDKKTGRVSITYELVGIEHLDYMRLFKKFTYTAQESYSLNHILAVLGLPLKVEYEGSLDDLYKSDFPKFMDYNVRDVDAVDDIDAKTNLMDQALTIAYDARIPIQDVFGTVKMWDQIVHCTLMEDKVVIPPMRHSAKGEQYAGAYVKEPRIGRHKWIASEDFASLYPSLIVWGNFSPETARGRITTHFDLPTLLDRGMTADIADYLTENNLALAANMTVWDKDLFGIFPKLCKKYMDDRKIYKKRMIQAKKDKEAEKANGTITPELEKKYDYEIARCNNMQMARKIQINSLYGAIGNAFFRYYSVDFAEAITLSGQLAAMWTERRLNEYMNQLFETEGIEYVIYADTDSNYLTFEPIIEKIFGTKDVPIEKKIEFIDRVEKEKIEPFITKCLEELALMMNAYQGDALVMKREAIADAGIWTGKKYYVMSVYDNEGVKYAEPDLKIMGIAAVKSSTPKYCRERIKGAIKIMLSGNQEELVRYVNQTKDEFFKLDFAEFASPTGVNGLKKYADSKEIFKSGCPGHVKAALIFNDLIKKRGLETTIPPIVDGDKIKYAKLKMPNPIFQDVIGCPGGKLPPELGLEKYIDREAAFAKSFISPVQSLVNAIGWSMEERATLDAWF
jgi:DNA polymerase elongation subunit (family B)